MRIRIGAATITIAGRGGKHGVGMACSSTFEHELHAAGTHQAELLALRSASLLGGLVLPRISPCQDDASSKQRGHSRHIEGGAAREEAVPTTQRGHIANFPKEL